MPRDLDGDDTDRAGAADEHTRPGRHSRFTDRGDAHRERLAQRRGIVGHRVRDGMSEVRTDGHVVAQRPVHWRCGIEPHVRAQVVLAPTGLEAARVRA